jgi:fibronectin-binding autotransporter adhesin
MIKSANGLINKMAQLLTAALLAFTSLNSATAATHVWSGATSGNWSVAGNWSSGGVPTLAETNILTFPAGATRFTVTNDIGALKIAAITLSGSGYVVRGASALNVLPNLININNTGSSNTIEAPLTFANTIAVIVGTGDALVLAGQLTGTGGLIKLGDGDLFLRGGAVNTFGGGLDVLLGSVTLGKTGGATAVSGPVTVGGTDPANLAVLRLEGSDQISGASDVTLNRAGGLFMQGWTNAVNHMTIWAGAVQTYWGLSPSPGLLRFNGNLTLAAWLQDFPLPDQSPIVLGQIEFIGASSSIYVSNANVVCEIDADIVEFGGATTLNKTGPGTLSLEGDANNYTGALNIQQGRVIAGHSTALGSIASGTTVSNGATLQLLPGVSSSDALALTGLGNDGQGALQLPTDTATLSGTVTLAGETGIGVVSVNGTLNLNGPISGSGGIRKFGDGTLSLNGFGNNTYSGASFVAKGRLTLNKSANVRAIGSVTVTNGAALVFNANELMDNAGVLSIYTGGSVNLTNRSETLGGLNLGRSVGIDTGSGMLTLLGDVYTGVPYTTSNGPVFIRGLLSLGGGSRRFHAPDTSFRFDCVISDGPGTGGLQLSGGGGQLGFGNFHFIRTNTFTGPVTADYAGLLAYNPWSFGTTAGGVIGTNNCEVILFNDSLAITGETLTVVTNATLFSTGNNAWNGPVVLSGTNSVLKFNPWSVGDVNTLAVNGHISGPGGLTVGDNLYYAPGLTVRLTQSNSYSGPTVISPGKLVIQHPQALGSTAQGTVITEDSTLELELPNGATVLNESLTFDSIYFYVTTSPPRLAVAGAVSNSWISPITTDFPLALVSVSEPGGMLSLNSSISGSGGIEKNGPGTLIFAGNSPNSFFGETKISDGTLLLSKPNGVQAASNVTVHFPGILEWAGSEQIANAATLSLEDADGLMKSYSETITHLTFPNGFASLSATTGNLTLLGDIDVTGTFAGLGATTLLSPGTHQITGFPNGTLAVTKSVHETGGGAGLAIHDLSVVLEVANSFNGTVALIDDAHLTVRHPSALGSTAQGVLTTNWSTLILDLPQGGVMDPEPLTFCASETDRAFLSLTENKTNTWSGPVTINGWGYAFAGPTQSRLILSGAVNGSGSLSANGSGTLVLTGSATNTFNGLRAQQIGTVRFAKPPGVPAMAGDLIINEFTNQSAKVVLDAANQFSPQIHVEVRANGTLNLNGHPATVRQLLGGGAIQGNGPLTISNSLPGLDSVFDGDFNSTLVKQGSGTVSLNGAFLGDLIIEGGMFNRVCTGAAGQTAIAVGAIVNSSGANFFNFGALSGAGTLRLSAPNTVVGGSLSPVVSSTFSGAIIGTNTVANLTKVGSGDLTLTGPVSLVSTMLVQNGTLLVNTLMTNPVQVVSAGPGNFPTLGGTGIVGHVTLTGVGARISPGGTTNVPSYGKLTVNHLTAGAGSGFLCEIGGTNAGVNLDQINATGIVTLNGGFANFTAFGTGTVSNRYVVVKSVSPVSGTFNGDPEGDLLFPAAGRGMTITYLTSAGKEITLVEQPGSNLENIHITGITQQTNGQVTLHGTGNPGSTYFIEANTNLASTNWITLGSVPGAWDGGISFTDTNAPSFPQRFYRFRLQ